MEMQLQYCAGWCSSTHQQNHQVEIRIACPPRSPDFNPCDIWLWGYLKAMVYRNAITSVSDLRESIERHVRNIPQLMLLSTAEHEILRFQMVTDNSGHHICYHHAL